jgi:predicted nucleic acid-binding protein
MPTNVERYAVDTSVAVAALDGAHGAHAECRHAARQHRPALAGHAAFEVFSVLTRMPGPAAIDSLTADELIRRAFPERIWLSDEATGSLLVRLGTLGITGGAVYDALVGEAARINNRTLLTRDLRARRTYDLLGVRHTFVGV